MFLKFKKTVQFICFFTTISLAPTNSKAQSGGVLSFTTTPEPAPSTNIGTNITNLNFTIKCHADLDRAGYFVAIDRENVIAQHVAQQFDSPNPFEVNLTLHYLWEGSPITHFIYLANDVSDTICRGAGQATCIIPLFEPYCLDAFGPYQKDNSGTLANLIYLINYSQVNTDIVLSRSENGGPFIDLPETFPVIPQLFPVTERWNAEDTWSFLNGHMYVEDTYNIQPGVNYSYKLRSKKCQSPIAYSSYTDAIQCRPAILPSLDFFCLSAYSDYDHTFQIGGHTTHTPLYTSAMMMYLYDENDNLIDTTYAVVDQNAPDPPGEHFWEFNPRTAFYGQIFKVASQAVFIPFESTENPVFSEISDKQIVYCQ